MNAAQRPRRRILEDDGRVPDEHWFAQTDPARATTAERVERLEAILTQLAARVAELGQAVGVRGVPSQHDRELTVAGVAHDLADLARDLEIVVARLTTLEQAQRR